METLGCSSRRSEMQRCASCRSDSGVKDRHDFLLYGLCRQFYWKVLEEVCRYAQLAHRACHMVFSDVSKDLLSHIMPNELRNHTSIRSNNMKLSRAKAEAAWDTGDYRRFAVLHTWGYFCKNNVSRGEGSVRLGPHLSQSAALSRSDLTSLLIDRCHGHEEHRRVIRQPWQLRLCRIDLTRRSECGGGPSAGLCITHSASPLTPRRRCMSARSSKASWSSSTASVISSSGSGISVGSSSSSSRSHLKASSL
jgi:hypothetical protein